jgi:uncharacterized membrane protein YczE
MQNQRKIHKSGMLKPIRWKTFPRDFFVIQVGFLLYGLSIALAIRANLGTGTWAVLDVALSYITGWTPGTMTVLVGFVVLVAALLMREQIGWGTLGNILSIGPWLDLMLYFIPSIENNWPVQLLMLLAGTLTQGIATAIYIGVDAGAGPRDSLMLAIKRTTGISYRLARGIIEVTVLVVGWLLGGPAGIGTAIHALLVGTAMQWAFKVFRVQPHQVHESNPATVESAAD